MARLHKLAGKPPEIQLSIPKANLPLWLVEAEEHKKVCEDEIRIYQKIAQLTRQISGRREEQKTKLLGILLSQHRLIIAFDSCLTTLADIKERLQHQYDCKVILATGSNTASKNAVKELAKLGSTASKTIALCSDAMAEGYNLQAASAVVHLDRLVGQIFKSA